MTVVIRSSYAPQQSRLLIVDHKHRQSSASRSYLPQSLPSICLEVIIHTLSKTMTDIVITRMTRPDIATRATVIDHTTPTVLRLQNMASWVYDMSRVDPITTMAQRYKNSITEKRSTSTPSTSQKTCWKMQDQERQWKHMLRRFLH